MAVNRIAVMDIGSSSTTMQIYEISAKSGITLIDRVRHRATLGKDTYAERTVRYERIEEVCQVLKEYQKLAKEYNVQETILVATSALREAKNRALIVDQIQLHTGLRVQIYSNSEQRYICYKAVASKEIKFNSLIEKGAAVVDVSSGSVQISLFDKKLISTQNMKIGTMRIQETIGNAVEDTDLKNIIGEFIDRDLQGYERMLLKDRGIHNLIVVSSGMDRVVRKYCKGQESLTAEQFTQLYEQLTRMSVSQLADDFEQSKATAAMIMTNLLVYKKVMDCFGAETMWLPQVNLSDGVAADYADKEGIVKLGHDFTEDILSSARYLSKRYKGSKTEAAMLEGIVGTIFDATRSLHGLGDRERMLLQIAAILQDCGRFINLSAPGECSYNIILSTEIIGLSHNERQMIAYIVKFNTDPVMSYEEMAGNLTEEHYLLITKLTAMLRLGTALLPATSRKLKGMKVEMKKNQLQITAETMEDMTLERILFQRKAEYFEQVFGICPVIRQKKGGN